MLLWLLHCFITTLRWLLHIDALHQASACCNWNELLCDIFTYLYTILITDLNIKNYAESFPCPSSMDLRRFPWGPVEKRIWRFTKKMLLNEQPSLRADPLRTRLFCGLLQNSHLWITNFLLSKQIFLNFMYVCIILLASSCTSEKYMHISISAAR